MHLLITHLMQQYQGPALWVSTAGRLVQANSKADAAFAAQPDLLPEILQQLSTSGNIIYTQNQQPSWAWLVIPQTLGDTVLLGFDISLQHNLQQVLLESRGRYKHLLDLSGETIWETDAAGCFSFCSASGLLGHQAADMIGQNATQLLPSQNNNHPFITNSAFYKTPHWLKAADGSWRYCVITAEPLPHGGARGLLQDTTLEWQQQQELAQLRRNEALHAHVTNKLRQGLTGQALFGDAARAIVYVLGLTGCAIFSCSSAGQNPNLEGAFGQAPPDFSALWHKAQFQLQHTELGLVQLTQYQDEPNGLIWCSTNNDQWHAQDSHAISQLAAQLGLALLQQSYQQQLQKLSYHDELTGLYNRRAFTERLQQRLSRAQTQLGGLLFIDLDNFKMINDQLGHEAGDKALQAVAELLCRSLRPGDMAGRLGGDEFVIWLDRISRAEAQAIGLRLLRLTAELQGFSANAASPLGFSLGLALPPPQDAIALLAAADAAMYKGKKQGKGRLAMADTNELLTATHAHEL